MTATAFFLLPEISLGDPLKDVVGFISYSFRASPTT